MSITCEVCGRPYHHKHHIIGRSFNGSNDLSNIAFLCASCHVDTHKGLIVIEGRFLTTSGYMLLYHMKGEESKTGMESDKVYIF